MQILCGSIIDDDTEINELTDEQLAEQANKRRDLRVRYPGMAALNFETLYNILMEDIIGWDTKENKATREAGLFGTPEAVICAFEEQGRKTIHVHMTLWLKGFK